MLRSSYTLFHLLHLWTHLLYKLPLSCLSSQFRFWLWSKTCSVLTLVLSLYILVTTLELCILIFFALVCKSQALQYRKWCSSLRLKSTLSVPCIWSYISGSSNICLLRFSAPWQCGSKVWCCHRYNSPYLLFAELSQFSFVELSVWLRWETHPREPS